MDAILDFRGARLDLEFRSGASMPVIRLALQQDTGAPVDLEGYTVDARAASRATPPVAVALDVTVVGDGTPGQIDVGMASTEVDKLSPVPRNVSSAPTVAGDWSLSIVAPDGTRTAVLYGEIRLGAASGAA